MRPDICTVCGKGWEVGQGKRFKTTPPTATYHDNCWPFVCCGECGYSPEHVGDKGLCYCR